MADVIPFPGLSQEFTADFHEIVKGMTTEQFGEFLQQTLVRNGFQRIHLFMRVVEGPDGPRKSYTMQFE